MVSPSKTQPRELSSPFLCDTIKINEIKLQIGHVTGYPSFLHAASLPCSIALKPFHCALWRTQCPNYNLHWFYQISQRFLVQLRLFNRVETTITRVNSSPCLLLWAWSNVNCIHSSITLPNSLIVKGLSKDYIGTIKALNID